MQSEGGRDMSQGDQHAVEVAFVAGMYWRELPDPWNEAAPPWIKEWQITRHAGGMATLFRSIRSARDTLSSSDRWLAEWQSQDLAEGRPVPQWYNRASIGY